MLAVPMGLLSPDAFSYHRVELLLENPFVRFIIFGILFLSLWHSAHRMRITLHDFGIRSDGIVMVLLYGLAAIASILLIIVLV